VLHHPWTGEAVCEATKTYRGTLAVRFASEAANLAELTGWQRKEIEASMAQSGETVPK
jgi:hypothetical protein